MVVLKSLFLEFPTRDIASRRLPDFPLWMRRKQLIQRFSKIQPGENVTAFSKRPSPFHTP